MHNCCKAYSELPADRVRDPDEVRWIAEAYRERRKRREEEEREEKRLLKEEEKRREEEEREERRRRKEEEGSTVRLADQLAAVVEDRLKEQYDAGMQPAPIHPNAHVFA